MIYLYFYFIGSAESFQTAFPQSPRKRSKSQIQHEGTIETKNDITAQEQSTEKNITEIDLDKQTPLGIII